MIHTYEFARELAARAKDKELGFALPNYVGYVSFDEQNHIILIKEAYGTNEVRATMDQNDIITFHPTPQVPYVSTHFVEKGLGVATFSSYNQWFKRLATKGRELERALLVRHKDGHLVVLDPTVKFQHGLAITGRKPRTLTPSSVTSIKKQLRTELDSAIPISTMLSDDALIKLKKDPDVSNIMQWGGNVSKLAALVETGKLKLPEAIALAVNAGANFGTIRTEFRKELLALRMNNVNQTEEVTITL